MFMMEHLCVVCAIECVMETIMNFLRYWSLVILVVNFKDLELV